MLMFPFFLPPVVLSIWFATSRAVLRFKGLTSLKIHCLDVGLMVVG